MDRCQKFSMLDLWRNLYSVADRLYALAPWSWMDDGKPFGIQDPVTGEIGFIHVTGQELSLIHI